MNDQPVNHRSVLLLLHILKRVLPTATVNGHTETARVGQLVFTVTLAPTIRDGEYDGVYLRTINPAVGELDTTKFVFREYGATTGSTRKLPLEVIAPYNVHRLTEGISIRDMENDVYNHTTAFTAAFYL